MSAFTHYRTQVGSRPDKFFKATLFTGAHLLVGINCLEPGQSQPLHEHDAADKVYIVMEGRGHFTVGAAVQEASPGEVIWAPVGVPHGVENRAGERLVVLVGMAPPPGE